MTFIFLRRELKINFDDKKEKETNLQARKGAGDKGEKSLIFALEDVPAMFKTGDSWVSRG